MTSRDFPSYFNYLMIHLPTRDIALFAFFHRTRAAILGAVHELRPLVPGERFPYTERLQGGVQSKEQCPSQK
jgi:hypothetical protein